MAGAPVGKVEVLDHIEIRTERGIRREGFERKH